MKNSITILSVILLTFATFGSLKADIPPNNIEMQRSYIYETLQKCVCYPEELRDEALNDAVEVNFSIDTTGQLRVNNITGNGNLAKHVEKKMEKLHFEEKAVWGKDYKIKISFIFHK